MGDLRRGKWIRDEKFVSGRDECVCDTVGASSMLRLMCNTVHDLGEDVLNCCQP
jgi:hypothetical protein